MVKAGSDLGSDVARARWRFLDQSRQVIIFPSIATELERRELLSWALEVRPELNLNPKGPYRAFRNVQELSRVADAHVSIGKRLTAALGLPKNIRPEAKLGWYLSIIQEGGNVHPHRDGAPFGNRHLRCNLFVQLPHAGGLPVVGGKRCEVAECDMLAFFPSEQEHYSDLVGGAKERIICSYGFTVDSSYCFPESSRLR